MKKKNIGSLIITVILAIAGFITLFPVYIAVVNSFKTNKDMTLSVLGWPTTFNFDNFTKAIDKLDFFKSTGNTIYLTVFSVVGIILISSMAGYKLARTNNKLSKFLYVLFVASMLIPFHSIMISLTKVSMVIGSKGSLTGLATIYIGLGLNMAIFLYVGFVKSIPLEIEEAAIMDGAGPFSTFFLIVFPLLKPITATIMILDALWVWNDFLLPLLMITNNEKYTLILSASVFFGKYSTDWTALLAGLLMTSVPMVIFYLIFQKHIVKGVAAGAIKG
jgi:raffinose/stachyose/melibiose transport system permease protein